MRKNITLLCFTLIVSVFIFTSLAQVRKMNMADYEKRKMEYIQKEAGLPKRKLTDIFRCITICPRKNLNFTNTTGIKWRK